MRRALALWNSSIGKKVLMAATGAVLYGYLVVHMIGNLQIFAGAEVLNGYAHALHANLVLLWGARVVLLASVIVHIALFVSLGRAKLAARPAGYKEHRKLRSSWGARTMYLSGPLVLLFILFHLAHLTLGLPVVPPEFAEGDVYANLVNGFQVPWVALIYITVMLLISQHLVHGAWSMFRTLGLAHPRYDAAVKGFAKVMTALIVVGFIAVPVAIAAHVIGGDAAPSSAQHVQPAARGAALPLAVQR